MNVLRRIILHTYICSPTKESMVLCFYASEHKQWNCGLIVTLMSCPSCLYELIQQQTTLTCVTSTSFLSHLSLFSLCLISPVFPTHFPIHTHIPPPLPAEAPLHILCILSITHVRIHLQNRSPRIALHEQARRLRRFTFCGTVRWRIPTMTRVHRSLPRVDDKTSEDDEGVRLC